MRKHGTSLEGKRALVVGLARSGQAAVALLQRAGASVAATDLRTASALGRVAADLKKRGVELVLGRHPASLFREVDLVVVSPGVPRSLSPLQAAREAGVEILSELELAARCFDGPVIAVTGTNGKSTTTTFVGHLLRSAGSRVFVGGNLGRPFSEAAGGDHDIAVVEVSSFQLEWVSRFQPAVAVLLNVTEDHLDRYEGFEDYAQTKGRIFERQDERDYAVVNAGDPVALEVSAGCRSRRYLFGHDRDLDPGMDHQGGAIHFREGGRRHTISLAGFQLRGRHNVENLMAACLAAHLAGVPLEQLEEVVPHLEGLPHRLELVAELDGVRYYNDSKATNVDSVLASLRDLSEPLVLLLGGKDKGGSFEKLQPIAARARAVVLFGQARYRLQEALEGQAEAVVVETLGEAVDRASTIARPGDSVVLSPACASFDQFSNYEERGEVFRRLVWEQGKQRAGAAASRVG